MDEPASASGAPTATAAQLDADGRRLAGLGYKQELNRVLTLFGNFSVAFCYLSPMVGIYSLFVLGVGSAGPRYPWLLPIVVAGALPPAAPFFVGWAPPFCASAPLPVVPRTTGSGAWRGRAWRVSPGPARC